MVALYMTDAIQVQWTVIRDLVTGLWPVRKIQTVNFQILVAYNFLPKLIVLTSHACGVSDCIF